MLTLTASQLRLMTMCERRVWLDKYGNREDRTPISPITTIRLAAGIQHEEQIHAATANNVATVPINSWEEGVQATRSAMAQGQHILGAYLEAQIEFNGQSIRLMGQVDRLERQADTIYKPIEIKRYDDLSDADLLQLDFYCFLVGQMQAAIPDGIFWMGINPAQLPAQMIAHRYDDTRFKASLSRWLTMVQMPDEPDVIYRSHCRECHWHQSCVNDLKKRRSVQLLHNIRRDSVQSLFANGIHTLDQFALLSLDEIRSIKGIKSTAERYHAQARAYVEGHPVWYETMPDVLLDGGTMFDLETMVDRNGEVWSLGWCDMENVTHIAVVNPYRQPTTESLAENLTISVVRKPIDTWYVLLDSIGNDDTPIYHWTGFDAGVMKAAAPVKVQNALLPRMHDLYKTFVNSVQLPVKSYSIKTVAAYFGFQWKGHAGWDAAYHDYKVWVQQDHAAALWRACEYQRDDVLAMVVVWQWMMQSQSASE